MPQDIEFMIAFRGPEQIIRAARKLGMVAVDARGVEIPVPDDFSQIRDLVFPDTIRGEVEADLREIHTLCLPLVKARISPENNVQKTGPLIVSTKRGDVHADPFWIAFVYDTENAGDAPEDATLGVSLNSRYQPILLDLEFENGLPMAFDLRCHAQVMESVQTTLEEHYPKLRGAAMILRTVFY